jgi:hypothetical protein
MGTPRRAGAPYGLPAQAANQGWVNLGADGGSIFSTPIDTHHYDIVETGNESWRFKNCA